MSWYYEGLDPDTFGDIEAQLAPKIDPSRPIEIEGDEEWNRMERELFG